MEETRKISRFISRLRYEHLPRAVVEKAKALVLDQLGCQLAGATMSWSNAIYQYVLDYSGPRQESTVVRHGLKTVAQDAAFANACFGNAFMGDDTDSVSHAHLGAIIIPSALALGEKEKIDGQTFITSLVAGYEVSARVGAAAEEAEARGFHPGPVFGPFGAAAGAGIILKFDERRMCDALGIAGSQAGGVMEYSKSGGSVNRLHAGMAAYGGLRAALMAQRGFSGPGTILEGERGFVRAYSGTGDMGALTRDLGRTFSIRRIDLKSHCCCGTAGANLDALTAIMAGQTIDPKEIAGISVYITPPAYRLTGGITRPRDITSAQFGARFGLALKLIKGANSFREYCEDNLHDPEILDLESKIDIMADEDLAKMENSDFPARVVVKMNNGRVYEETVLAPKGSVLNPMDQETLETKFRSLAAAVLSAEAMRAVIKTVARLDTVSDVREISKMLAVA